MESDAKRRGWDRLTLLQAEGFAPSAGEFYRHYKVDGAFEVLAVGIDEEVPSTVRVTYLSRRTQMVLVRTLENFVEDVGGGARRFSRIPDPARILSREEIDGMRAEADAHAVDGDELPGWETRHVRDLLATVRHLEERLARATDGKL